MPVVCGEARAAGSAVLHCMAIVPPAPLALALPRPPHAAPRWAIALSVFSLTAALALVSLHSATSRRFVSTPSLHFIPVSVLHTIP
ncbi:jg15682 [Pararge aegeria aegeria]|uniref:Jg15682 protein n=1 Tax=Pararge aegeria aegeria TaxID=348720 RepID=A0A8S4QTC4_9NEOP|nr:jg15682 [Pararge aegeria aegeria]